MFTLGAYSIFNNKSSKSVLFFGQFSLKILNQLKGTVHVRDDVRSGIKKQREKEGEIQLPFPPTRRSTPSALFLRHPLFFFFF